MIWMFLVAGVVFGAAIWGWPGAIVLGFVGWLTGIIVRSMKKPMPGTATSPTPASVATAAVKTTGPFPSAAARFEALERRVAELEARVGIVPSPQPAPAPVVEATPVAEFAQPPVEALAPIPSPQPSPQPSPKGEGELPPTPPKPPAPPPPPSEPNFIVRFFTGGNTIVRVGLVILFFGLAFLVKYGVEHDMVPVELRIMGVAAFGLVLLVLGWRLRSKREGYALSLQGAGVAILYLTIFGALRLYHLLPAGLAFALLALIAAFSAFLAIAQDSLALAVIGAAGGFLAPILASTGGGSHVMLFSYYLLLNAGIVAVAWFKAWRPLNLVGFLFTFFIGLAWGLRSYKPEYFDTTEPFVIAFFLIYLVVAILFARKQAADARVFVDGMIVFGNPAVAFGLQAGLMRDTEFGLAFSSVALAIVYLVLAAVLQRRQQERWTLLSEAFLALGVVFATLAIPLALDARWTSAAWALEGAAVVWVGVRQKRPLARAFGILLQFAAGVAYLMAIPRLPQEIPVANAACIGALLLAFAGLWTNRLLAREEVSKGEKSLAPLLFLWGMAWWLFAGIYDLQEFVPEKYAVSSLLIFLSATAFIFCALDARLDWREARWPLRVLPIVLLLGASVYALLDHTHPAQNLGWIAWPFAFAVHFGWLKRAPFDQDGGWFTVMHAMGVVALAVVLGLELEWIFAEYTEPGTAWALASRITVLSIVMLAMASTKGRSMWPVSAHKWAYLVAGGVTLTVLIALWSLRVNFSHGGRSDPLPYLPLLNALDLAHILAIIAVTSLWLAMRKEGLETPRWLRGRIGIVAASGLVFIWLNAALLRTIHHWADIPYGFDTMGSSVLVQASLSVFWAFLALAGMVFATRGGRRAVWMTGAALMAIVVVKLVLVDLERLSGIERIVSFIGVGVLMLVIGYFSPVPPKKKEEVAG